MVKGQIIQQKNLSASHFRILSSGPAFKAALPKLVKNKTTPVVMLCQAGSRAARAASQAQKWGYTQAQPLAGGLKAWREASLPIDKA